MSSIRSNNNDSNSLGTPTGVSGGLVGDNVNNQSAALKSQPGAFPGGSGCEATKSGDSEAVAGRSSVALGSIALGNTVRGLRPITEVAAITGVALEAGVKAIIYRLGRYVLRSKWSRLSMLKGLHVCGHAMQNTNVRLVSKDGKIAHYRGVLRCASAWACAVCAATIRAYRSQEIKQGVLYAMNELGYSVYMVTRTQQHTLKHSLKEMMQSMSNAKRQADCSGNVKRLYDTLGRIGAIMAKEVTRSYANGWHVHTHELMFFRHELTDEQELQLTKVLYNAMNKQFTRLGYGKLSASKGIKVQHVTKGAKEVGEYLSKLDSGFNADLEMTRSDIKKGRNGSRVPMQILTDFLETGDTEDMRLYQEYELATKGHHVLHWTKGLKELLQIKEPELTDEELVEKEVGGLEYLEFDNWYFKVIKQRDIDGHILAAFYFGGVTGVLNFLTEQGLFSSGSASLLQLDDREIRAALAAAGMIADEIDELLQLPENEMFEALEARGLTDVNACRVLNTDEQEIKTAFDVKLDKILKQADESRKQEKQREDFKDSLYDSWLRRGGWQDEREKSIYLQKEQEVDNTVNDAIIDDSDKPTQLGLDL